MSVTGRLKQAYIASRVAHDYAQAESRFVSVDGARLHFVIKGAGRPVVLIHGNPGSCQDWARLYTPISSRYQVVAFDRPGHGHSDRPNHRDITVNVQAEMLHTALRELQIERPILVGHSWGGALALAYAVEFPDDVSGLVLLAPAVYESDDGVSFLSKLPGFPIIGDIVNFLFTPLIGPWVVRTDVTKAFAPDAIPKHYLRHVLSEWTRPKKVKWYSVDDALLNEQLPKLSSRYAELIESNPHESDSFASPPGDSVSNGSRLRMPVSIVTGDSDLIVPATENAHRLSTALPHSELIVLEKTGHQILFTRPDAVVEAIDQVAGKAERPARR
jgi:pimeloyl-ACP methyl ester carboxylesterase